MMNIQIADNYKLVLFDKWANVNLDGVIVLNKKNIKFYNEKASELFSNSIETGMSLSKLIRKDELTQIFKTGKGVLRRDKLYLEISLIEEEQITLLVIHDITKVIENEKKIKELEELNQSLRAIYENYADDTIVITDNEGNVEFFGSAIPGNCGVSSNELHGSNVYDLEKRGVFTPSVTVKVLQTKKPEVMIQTTKIGKRAVTFGNPIFGEDGNISKVVSITRDFSKQIKIGTLLSAVEEDDIPNLLEMMGTEIITCDNKMLNIVELACLVAKVDSTVLINGETGTGKEVFANFIYRNSPRKDNPFIKVNCGTISPNIVESELFGYEPGSFTGANKAGKTGLIEAANGGTLFLDEVSELPLNQQVKLLQVLQERTMIKVGGTETIKLDIRVIAATNKPLETQVEEGKFREDLYYRLNVVPIQIPPLRERPDDVPLLTRYFLDIFNKKYDKEQEFSSESFNALIKYQWPGNVRELENTIERLVITTQPPFIEIDDLPEKIIKRNPMANGDAVIVNRIEPLADAIAQLEEKLIKMAIAEYGNGKKAAQALGINQSTISRKLKIYNP